MVICNECKNETHYKNRFYNKCQECGSTITHVCWNCKNEINPQHPRAIESPLTHYHKCPHCGVLSEEENEKEFNELVDESINFLKENNWLNVLPKNEYPKFLQLVITLLGNKGTKYFCPHGISAGKPKKEFRKFWVGLNINPIDEELRELFNDVDDYIEKKNIGDIIYAKELKKSILTNTENLALLDYFVCMGQLKKTSLQPAKYEIISKEIKRCNFLVHEKKNKCPKCNTHFGSDIKECPECIYKRNSKNHKKGEHYELIEFKWDTVCGCKENIKHYWENLKKEKDGDNSEQ